MRAQAATIRSLWFWAAVALLGNATRCQTVLHTFPLGSYDIVTHIGDVDGDGVRDLAFERVLGPSVPRPLDIYSVRTGALLFHFAPPPQQSYGEVFSLGDIDGDGRADIAHRETGPLGFKIVIRSGATGAVLTQLSSSDSYLTGITDLNADQRDEYLVSDVFAAVNGMSAAGRCDVIDGATGQVLRSHLGTFMDRYLGALAALGDLDADGTRDYAIHDSTTIWGISGATGTVVFTLPKWSSNYGTWMRDIGDFNADGYDDIVFFDFVSWPTPWYEAIHVLAGPTATQPLWSHFNWLQNPGPIYYYWHSGGLGDIDGDGYDDLGLTGGAPGVGATIVSGRNLSIVWEHTAATTGVPGLIHYGLDGPGDVNGDGVPDLLVRGGTSQQNLHIALVAFAQPGVSTIGLGCPSPSSPSGKPPTIGIGVGARLGRTMTVNLSDANPNLLAAILGGGTSDQRWNGTPLPLALAPLGLPGCFWRVAADATLTVPTIGLNGTPHHATVSLTVPSTQSLLGAAVFWQWFVLEPGPGLTASVTAAMRTVIVP